MRHFALIMAGGEGTRLAPLSTPERPKQFVKIFEGMSLFQKTYARIRPLFEKKDIYVATHQKYAHWLDAQVPQIPPEQRSVRLVADGVR